MARDAPRGDRRDRAALERIQRGKPAYEPLREPRYVPTKEAIDRMDEALDWLAWLDERGLNLVTLRAFRVPWSRSFRGGLSHHVIRSDLR
ncbi:MAG: DUF6362 family protein [Stellaceae bacterium]